MAESTKKRKLADQEESSPAGLPEDGVLLELASTSNRTSEKWKQKLPLLVKKYSPSRAGVDAFASFRKHLSKLKGVTKVQAYSAIEHIKSHIAERMLSQTTQFMFAGAENDNFPGEWTEETRNSIAEMARQILFAVVGDDSQRPLGQVTDVKAMVDQRLDGSQAGTTMDRPDIGPNTKQGFVPDSSVKRPLPVMHFGAAGSKGPLGGTQQFWSKGYNLLHDGMKGLLNRSRTPGPVSAFSDAASHALKPQPDEDVSLLKPRAIYDLSDPLDHPLTESDLASIRLLQEERELNFSDIDISGEEMYELSFERRKPRLDNYKRLVEQSKPSKVIDLQEIDIFNYPVLKMLLPFKAIVKFEESPKGKMDFLTLTDSLALRYNKLEHHQHMKDAFRTIAHRHSRKHCYSPVQGHDLILSVENCLKFLEMLAATLVRDLELVQDIHRTPPRGLEKNNFIRSDEYAVRY